MTDNAALFERAIKSTSEATARLRVRSSVNPTLWMCGIVSIPCFIAGAVKDGTYGMALFVVGCVPLAVYVLGYVWFMLRDPDRLQSEDFQLQKRALNLIEEKGGAIAVLPTSLELLTNPSLRALPAPEEER